MPFSGDTQRTCILQLGPEGLKGAAVCVNSAIGLTGQLGTAGYHTGMVLWRCRGKGAECSHRVRSYITCPPRRRL